MQALTQRQIAHVILGFSTLITLLLTIYDMVYSYGSTYLFTTSMGTVGFSLLWLAYWRGWDAARYVTVGVMTILAVFGMPLTAEFIPALALVVPTLALVLTSPAWVIGSAFTQIIALIGRAYLVADGDLAAMGSFGSIADLLVYTLTIGGLVLSRTMLDALLHASQESAERDARARAQAEAQAQTLAKQAAALDHQLAEQRRLLDLVSTLETPAVSLADGVLLAPLVGALDSRRIQGLTSRLLNTVTAQRAHMVVIDIAGVSALDTEVAAALLQTVYSLRLLGCQVTITGISAAVASSLTSLGVSLRDVQVARSPQEVLRAA